MRKPGDNYTPAEMVRDWNEKSPHMKMRLGTKEDLKDLGLHISFYPQSRRSKSSTSASELENSSPQGSPPKPPSREPSEWDLKMFRENEEFLKELLSKSKEETTTNMKTTKSFAARGIKKLSGTQEEADSIPSMPGSSKSKGNVNQEAKSAIVSQGQERPFFKGYPYLVIRIVRSLFHTSLLSAEQYNHEELLQLAQVQANANKLEVCLVTNENAGVYFKPKGKPCFSKDIPKGGIFIKDRLRLSVDQPVGTDLLRRESELETFIKSAKQTGYLTGDLRKGGREATQEELICLQGVQENGLPKGLVICPVCGDYRGECLARNPTQLGLVVRVSCYCENDNLCAYCGGKLSDRKLNGNRYEPKDGKIWHTPGFSGLGHRCSKPKTPSKT